MSLFTITKAVNASIARSVVISELKHTAKIEDITLQLASAKDLRLKDHAKKHTEATQAHATWYNNQTPAGQQQFMDSMSLLQAAITPTPSST